MCRHISVEMTISMFMELLNVVSSWLGVCLNGPWRIVFSQC